MRSRSSAVWLLLIALGAGGCLGGEPEGALVGIDIAKQVGIAMDAPTWSVRAGDFDGDGLDDFVLVRHFQEPSILYRNNRETNRFTQVFPGLLETKDRHSCDWGDVDQNGRADLYCTLGAQHGTVSKANELWLQQSNGTFVEKAAEYGVTDPLGRGRTPVLFDANHDQYPDLFVGNLSPREDGLYAPNRLFLNERGTRFVEVPNSGVTKEHGGRCAQTMDFDGDGWQDLLVCGAGLHLYRNVEGRFEEVTEAVGIKTALAVGEMADLNGDGRLDLARVESTLLSVQIQRSDGMFAAPVAVQTLRVGRALAVGDINGDERPDIYVATGGVETNEPDFLLVNDGSGESFTPAKIPQAKNGRGDTVEAIDYDGDGRTEFLVLNGAWANENQAVGRVQLIAFR